MNTEIYNRTKSSSHHTLTHLNAGAQKNTVFGPETIKKDIELNSWRVNFRVTLTKGDNCSGKT